MPKRVEEQYPSGFSGAFVCASEYFFNAIGMANLHDCRLCCDQGAQLVAFSSDPFPDRDGEAAFTLERLGLRQDSLEPFA